MDHRQQILEVVIKFPKCLDVNYVAFPHDAQVIDGIGMSRKFASYRSM